METLKLFPNKSNASLRKRFADPRYGEWRKEVLKRDKWKCQECGLKSNLRGDGLHAHHRRSYTVFPSLRYNVDNGVTLCKRCHEREHELRKKGRGRWI